ncbi:hypothetical protein ColKHC_09283 [Colletotrichum higginsianum]|nr:hypothetical protein ColKHC_09283 [Colletotrichum higginsianum]
MAARHILALSRPPAPWDPAVELSPRVPATKDLQDNDRKVPAEWEVGSRALRDLAESLSLAE